MGKNTLKGVNRSFKMLSSHNPIKINSLNLQKHEILFEDELTKIIKSSFSSFHFLKENNRVDLYPGTYDS